MKEYRPADLSTDLADIREYFERSTRSLTEAGSGFVPAEGTFTTAQQVAHVAQTIEWFFEGAFRPCGFSMQWEAMDRQVRSGKSLAEGRLWLECAFAAGQAAIASHSAEGWEEPLPEGPILGGTPRFTILGAIGDRTAHHRGALAVYARLRGKVAPMPYEETPEA
ncbi:MAG: DinB family protein [Bryobacteraceae bacterium]